MHVDEGESLFDLYGMWGSSLIRVGGRAKHPISKGWNHEAAERNRAVAELPPQEWESAVREYLGELEAHVAQGGNVGLAIPDGTIVIDADSAEAVSYLERIPALADAPAQETAKGRHYMLREPDAAKSWPQSAQVEIAPGIHVDLRLAGKGQIVCEPSVHPSGSEYSWVRPLPKTRKQLPDFPLGLEEAISKALRAKTQQEAAVRADGGKVAEGGRTSFLVSRAGAYVNGGLRGAELLAALRGLNRDLCAPPLPDAEVEKLALSASGKFEQKGTTWTAPQAVASEEPWEEPIDFRDPPLEDFPVWALPDSLRPLAESISETLDNPPAMAANTMLGIVSFATSRVARVRINENYIVSTNLFTCCVASKGAGKSPTFEHTEEVAKAWVASVLEECGPDIRAAQELWDQLLKMFDEALGKASKEAPAIREMKMKLAAREKGEHLSTTRPSLPKLRTGNFSEAALADALARSDERVLVCNDEGAALFDSLAGKHSSSGMAEASLFASGWAGGSFIEDRMGRQGANLSNPLISVVTVIQPDKLSGTANLRSLLSQGVLDRFAWAVCDATSVPANPRPISTGAKARYAERVGQILRIPTIGQPFNALMLRPSPEASALRTEFIEGLIARLRPDGDLEGLDGLIAKLRTNVEKVAGVLHMVDNPDTRAHETLISGETWARANAIGEFWLSHGLHVFGLLDGRPGYHQADRILAKIRRVAAAGDLGEGRVDRSYLLQQLVDVRRGSIRNVEQFNEGLDLLRQYGWVREEKQERKRVVSVNPRVFDSTPRESTESPERSAECGPVRARPLGLSGLSGQILGVESDGEADDHVAGALPEEALEASGALDGDYWFEDDGPF